VPRIAILDTYYPEFLDNYPFDWNTDYSTNLARLLHDGFGTGDFYSLNLRKLGWECEDIIVNSTFLRKISGCTLYEQLDRFKPDVIFCQALGLVQHELDLSRYIYDHPQVLLAAQCSCPVNRQHIPDYEVIFTSFPYYIPLINSLDVRAIYNPLSFEPDVLRRLMAGEEARRFDISFVGGVGNPSHWSMGMQLLNEVAHEFPQARFYGYGYDRLLGNSVIQQRYCGPAWGLSMYDVYLRSKIVINRHGEVARDYANNMRMYEATGCGALLLTEAKTNLHHLFNLTTEIVPYQSISHAIERIHYYLDPAHEDERVAIAAAGQRRTLTDHTYYKRMEVISDVLKDML